MTDDSESSDNRDTASKLPKVRTKRFHPGIVELVKLLARRAAERDFAEELRKSRAAAKEKKERTIQ